MEGTQTHQDLSSRFVNVYDDTWLTDFDNDLLLELLFTTPMDHVSYASTEGSFEGGNGFDTIPHGVMINDFPWPLMADSGSNLSPGPLWPDQPPVAGSLYMPQSEFGSTPSMSVHTSPSSDFCQAEVPLVLQQYQPTLSPPTPRLVKDSVKRSRRKTDNVVSLRQPGLLTLDVNFKQDANGDGDGQVLVLGKRKRSRFNEKDRSATAQTRRRGACKNCHRQKKRCGMPDDLFTPCKACWQSSTPLLIHSCIRAKVLDISLFRLGSTVDSSLEDWNQRLNARYGASGLNLVKFPHPTRKLLITQDLGLTLEVTVSLFEPGPGDPLSYKWKTAQGDPRKFYMPPYYISDMERADEDMRVYCDKSYSMYIQQLLDAQNPIVWQTFKFACKHTAAKSNLVSDALRIWAATRLTERPWRICGEDTLGVDPSSHSGTPWAGQVPVTPIMDTQLDDIVLKSILLPAQQRVLTELEHKLKNKKRHDWFEIYLFMFITMSNFEFIFEDMIDYTTRHGIDGTPQGRPSLNESHIRACKTLLSYFHFAYNGTAPLKIKWHNEPIWTKDNDDVNDILDPEQRQYMQRLQYDIAQQESQFESLKTSSMYSRTPMYWCHQILSKQWRADTPDDGATLEFTEKEFLTW